MLQETDIPLKIRQRKDYNRIKKHLLRLRKKCFERFDWLVCIKSHIKNDIMFFQFKTDSETIEFCDKLDRERILLIINHRSPVIEFKMDGALIPMYFEGDINFKRKGVK